MAKWWVIKQKQKLRRVRKISVSHFCKSQIVRKNELYDTNRRHEASFVQRQNDSAH